MGFSMRMLIWILSLYTVFWDVEGHGYLVKPPGRSSMWLFNYDVPPNYQHNELFCGGFPVQWWVNDGKCGVCGDPYNGVRENEPPNGKYATGKITEVLIEGQTIDIEVQITASHKGYFEFRLCPNNNASVTVTQDCLNHYLLTESSSGGTKVYVDDSSVGHYSFTMNLPKGVSCDNCVLQWRYRTGNRWGCYNNDFQKGPCGLGWGPQEEFYACSDIKIASLTDPRSVTVPTTSSSAAPTTTKPITTTLTTLLTTTPVPTTSTNAASSKTTVTTTATTATTISTTTSIVTSEPSTTTTTTTTTEPTSTTTKNPTPTTEAPPTPEIVCKAVGAWEGSAAMDNWCDMNCNAPTPYCPPSHCICGTEGQLKLENGLLGSGKDCVSVRRDPGWDMWCKYNCPLGLCYLGTMCTCSDLYMHKELKNIYGPR